MGKLLGMNARLHNISLLLGPGVNIKRSPLCGRNFEYFSEDPYLSGELGAAYIRGVQSQGVSSCVKHFAGNNQETRRLTVNSIIDERALREIYLPAFKRCIDVGADAVMAAYNSLNGAHCTENHRLLSETLKEEWDFQGIVISDWGAVTNDAKAVEAGCDLKMPGTEKSPKNILNALDKGILSKQDLEKAAERITAFLLKAKDNKALFDDWGKSDEDMAQNHNKARELAAESMVLLKNNGTLPLSKDKKILVIGEYAEKPHFQGGGSSKVNVFKIDGTLEALLAEGYDYKYISDFNDTETILEEANKCDVALVFMGTTESEESEGFDRVHIDLPENQNKAVFFLSSIIPTCCIVFSASAVTMPWIDKVDSVLEAYMPGEAGGVAVLDIISGKVNPSGKLAETFPIKLPDNSAYLFFPGVNDTSLYGESIFVGYRYYDKKEIKPLFPFGHGLSYTSFSYSNARSDKEVYKDTEDIIVYVTLTNTGKVEGKEVVQLYVSPTTPTVIRPEKELKEFSKVHLNPGESKEIMFTLNSSSFAWYDTDISDWRVDSGSYRILFGSSSADIRSEIEIKIESTRVEKKSFTRDSLLSEVWDTPIGRAYLSKIIKKENPMEPDYDKASDDAELKIVLSLRLKTLIFIGIPEEEVDRLISELNQEVTGV